MVTEPRAGQRPFATVWVVTYPLLITYLTQKLLTTVDTALLGRFSTSALASAGLAAPVYIVATVVAVGWATAPVCTSPSDTAPASTPRSGGWVTSVSR